MKNVVALTGAVGTSLLVLTTMTMTTSNVWAAPAPNCAAAMMKPNVPSVPANLPGFGYSALTATSKDVHLFTTTGTTTGSPSGSSSGSSSSSSSGSTSTHIAEVPLTIGPVTGGLLKITPTTPLTPGTSYELTYESFCSCAMVAASAPLRFKATAEAPLPTKIGDLVKEPTVGLDGPGSGMYIVHAFYKLLDEMKPWAGVYTFTLVFDGRVLAMRETSLSTTGDTVELVGSGAYGMSDDAELHKHTVQLRAILPFAPTIDSSEAEMEFAWPAPTYPTPPPTAAPFAPRPPTSTVAPESGSSCAMSTVHESTSSSFAPLAFFLAMLMSVASRARRR